MLTAQTQRTLLWLPRRRKGRGEKDWEFGISRCSLLYTERISNKVLLYSTGNCIQHSVTIHNGKEYEKRIRALCLVAQSCPPIVTPWTLARQAPLSVGILQARILEWGCHSHPQGIFPTQGSNPGLHIVDRFFTVWATRETQERV